MNDDELEHLRALDWEEIAMKVANFASSEARNRYGWNGAAMTKGTSPEDLACDAIAEFWQEPSRYSGKCSLTTFLCGIIRHKLWNVAKWEETRTTSREDNMEAVAGFTANPSPDTAAGTSDAFAVAISLLSDHSTVKGKNDHELVVTALACGCFEPDELAKETGLPIKRIYQVQRELNAIYPAIKKQLFNEKGVSHANK